MWLYCLVIWEHMRILKLAMAAVVLSFGLILPGTSSAAGSDGGVAVKVISADKLPNVPGNQLTAVMVALAPGSSAPKHHHAGFVFAYVVSGTVRSQLNGGDLKDYKAGQSWVEPPGTEHTLTANPSHKIPARLLAVFVAPEDAQLTTYNK